MNDNSAKNKNIRWLYINKIEELESYSSIWKACLSDAENALFNSPEWILQWKNTFWEKNWSLHLYIAFNEDECVLFAPFYIQKNTVFPFIKSLSLLGQGETETYEVSSEYQDIFVNEEFYFLLTDLSLKINNLSFDQANFKALLERANLLALFSSIKNSFITEAGTRYTYSSLKNTSPILSKNNKSKLNKCKNKLTALNAEYIWVKEEDYDYYWRLMKDLHQTRWTKLGKTGAFNNPKFSQFHNNFRKNQIQNVKISAVVANNTPIAIHYYFSANNTLYFYQSGWDEEKYANTSPGFALHLWSMKNSPVAFYDLMMGSSHNSYKAKLGCNSNQKMNNICLIKNKLKVSLNRMMNIIIYSKIKFINNIVRTN